MATILNNAVPFAMGAVVIVLLMGFANMLRGGSANKSQLLMRWRVGLQFLVIVLVLTIVWLRGG